MASNGGQLLGNAILTAAHCSAAGITIYTGYNFAGVSEVVPLGTFRIGNLCDGTLPILNVGADNVRSVQVPAGYKVTLWQDCVNSNAMVVTADTPDLGWMAGSMATLRVELIPGLAFPFVFFLLRNSFLWASRCSLF